MDLTQITDEQLVARIVQAVTDIARGAASEETGSYNRDYGSGLSQGQDDLAVLLVELTRRLKR